MICNDLTILVLAGFFLWTPYVTAEIINVPEDFETIQDGIDASENGDTVLVEPGEYIENIDFSGKDIVVGSLFMATGEEDFVTGTIIDGDEQGSVVTFERGETDEALLIGFSIQRGRAGFGGGIFCNNSSPTIHNCIISGNRAVVDGGWGHGGGIHFESSSSSIRRCLIAENSAADAGGAVSIRSAVEIVDCIIFNNRAGNDGGGIWFGGDSSDDAQILRCLIYNNRANNPNNGIGGGGVAFNHSDAHLLNCTIVSNFSQVDGSGGLALWECSPEIRNSIVYDNNGNLYTWRVGEFVVEFSDIQDGAEGEGNIDLNPLFVNPDNDDYHLTEDSPCIDAGDPDDPLDYDGSRADMGAFFFDHGNGAPMIEVEPDFIQAEESSEHVINIFNDGDSRLWWSTVNEAAWIELDRHNGIILPGGDLDFFVTLNAEDLNPGAYEDDLHILSNDPENPDLEINIVMFVGGGRPPVWIQVPEPLTVDETDEVAFNVHGDDPDGNDLTIEFRSDNLPEAVRFIDFGDGSGAFNWQTTYEDAGNFTAIFILSDGVFPVDAEVSITVCDVNRPPELIDPIEDIEVDEDSEPVEVADLNRIFFDPDGDELEFDVSRPEGVDARITDEDRFILQPEPDWNGTTTVMITARDSVDLVVDTVNVSVRPINDLSTAFSLILPADSSWMTDYPDIEFIWEASIDIVEDSVMTYTLFIAYNQETHSYTNITETTHCVSRGVVSNDPDEATDIVWQVWAYDGIDSIRCNRPFFLIVAPLSANQLDVDLIPTKLALLPAYPNPFNTTTTITYTSPASMHLSLAVYNLSGHKIATLVDVFSKPGVYSTVLSDKKLSSGLYFICLEASGEVRMRKVILLR